MHWITLLLALINELLADRSRLALENIALRQQVAVLKRSVKCAKIDDSDRIFWILMRRLLDSWRETLLIVKPETVIKWQYVQVRLACSVGVSPTRVGVRDPLAWIALVKETKLMESIDKARVVRKVDRSVSACKRVGVAAPATGCQQPQARFG
jgi:hypothetical protein